MFKRIKIGLDIKIYFISLGYYGNVCTVIYSIANLLNFFFFSSSILFYSHRLYYSVESTLNRNKIKKNSRAWTLFIIIQTIKDSFFSNISIRLSSKSVFNLKTIYFAKKRNKTFVTQKQYFLSISVIPGIKLPFHIHVTTPTVT